MAHKMAEGDACGESSPLGHIGGAWACSSVPSVFPNLWFLYGER